MRKLLNLLVWSLVFIIAFSLVGCKEKEPISDDTDNGNIIDDNGNGVVLDPILPVLGFLRDGDLWAMDVSGEQRQLTEFGDVTHVAWSPDELRIALWRGNRELWVLREDGTEQERIARNVTVPGRVINERGLAWHPWGGKIAYGVTGEQKLYIKDFLSNDSRTVNLDGELDQGPWWMPGGEMLFAVTLKDGIYKVTLISEKGSFIQHLEYLVQPHWTPGGVVFLEYDGVSPGGVLAFTGVGAVNGLGEDYRRLLNRQMDRATIALSASGRYLALATEETLDIIDLATGNRERVLSQEIVPSESETPYPLFFAWSQGADKLAALKAGATAVGAGEVQFHWDIVVIEPGKPANAIWLDMNFVLPMTWDNPLTWSLDDGHIYVLQNQAGSNYDVWVIDTEGNEPRLFLENAGLPFVRGAGLYPMEGK